MESFHNNFLDELIVVLKETVPYCFLIKDTKQESMKILWNDISEIVESDARQQTRVILKQKSKTFDRI